MAENKVIASTASSKVLAGNSGITTLELKELYEADSLPFTKSTDEDGNENGCKCILPLANGKHLYMYSETVPNKKSNWIRLANENGNDHWICTNEELVVTL